MSSWNLKQLFFIAIASVFWFLSFIFNNFLQLILFLGFVFILPFILNKFFTKYDNRVYIVIVTSILLLSTIFYSIWTKNSDLFNIGTYTPFLAGLIFAFELTWDRRKYYEKFTIFRKGIAFLEEKKFTEALDKFDETLELDPKYLPASINRALTLGFLERHNEAINASNDILLRHPNDFIVLNLKAHVLLKVGKCDEALEIVERTLKEPSLDDNLLFVALVNKGEILFEKGSYHETIEYYEQALEKVPLKKTWKLQGSNFSLTVLNYEIAKVWLNKGKAYQKLQQLDEALNSFEEALKLDPENQEVLKAKKELLGLMN
jgi:tetratricopeptide (TPR) repeat protein